MWHTPRGGVAMIPRVLRLHPKTYQRLIVLRKEAERDGAYRVAKRMQAVVLNSKPRLASVSPRDRHHPAPLPCARQSIADTSSDAIAAREESWLHLHEEYSTFTGMMSFYLCAPVYLVENIDTC